MTRGFLRELRERAALGRGLVQLFAHVVFANLGAQMGALALSLLAIQLVGAGAAELGILNALAFTPHLLFVPLAGPIIERLQKRTVLMFLCGWAALLLAGLALAMLLADVTIYHFYLAGLGLGSFTAFWQVALSPYVVTVVGRPRLLEGNSYVLFAISTSRIAGPALAGFVVATFAAPFALLLNALAFVLGGLGLSRVPRTGEPTRPTTNTSFWRDCLTGFSLVLGDARLRAVTAAIAHYNVAAQLMGTVFVLFAVTELGLGAEAVGAVLTVGQAGALLGPVLATRLARIAAVGPAMIGLLLVNAMLELLIPLTPARGLFAVVWLGGALIFHSIAIAAVTVQAQTIRQQLVPDAVMGRTTASYIVLTLGVVPIGALLGGILGEVIGLRETLIVGALAMHASWIWVLLSPLRATGRLQVTPAQG